MIPHTSIYTIHIGPIPIQVWGLLVAVGLLVGLILGRRLIRQAKLDEEVFFDLSFKLLIGGFVGARVVHVFLYHWDSYRENLISVLYLWQGGFSSTGGFAGAFLVLLWWQRSNRKYFWKYTDILAYILPAAWFFGRIGCFLIHDHPGICTDFALGMNQPTGCTRHDLGLYEALQMLVIGVVFFLIKKKFKEIPDGFFLGLLLLLYSIPRFVFDFLRIGDQQYVSLTPAQWGSIIMAIVGTHILLKKRSKREKI